MTDEQRYKEVMETDKNVMLSVMSMLDVYLNRLEIVNFFNKFPFQKLKIYKYEKYLKL